MSHHEWKRSASNERARELVAASERRGLNAEELAELRCAYTGAGGLVPPGWDSGQFYTPAIVTKFVVDMLGITRGDVLESSCGTGAFIDALPGECAVTGYEIDGTAARIAQMVFPRATIRRDNALEKWGEVTGRYDFAVGNPPFTDLPKMWALDGFPRTQKLDYAVWPFIEMGLHALRPNGLLGYIVPEGILNNRKDSPLRDWIAQNFRLLAVISLPTETFLHAGTQTKTSLIVIRKGTPPAPDDQLFFGICEEIGWNSRRQETGKCDLPEILAAWRKFCEENPSTGFDLNLSAGAERAPVVARLGEVEPLVSAAVDKPLMMPETDGVQFLLGV